MKRDVTRLCNYIVKIQIDKIWRIKNARELCASVIDIRRTVVLPQCALYGLLVQGPTSFVSWNISSFVRRIIYPNFRRPISYVYICLIPDKSFSVENFAPIRQGSIIVILSYPSLLLQLDISFTPLYFFARPFYDVLKISWNDPFKFLFVCLSLLLPTANCRKLSQMVFSCKRERILYERIRQENEGDENWRIILRIRDRNESIPSISNRSIVVSVKGSCSRMCLRALRRLSIRYSIPWYWISFLSSSTTTAVSNNDAVLSRCLSLLFFSPAFLCFDIWQVKWRVKIFAKSVSLITGFLR